MQSILQYRRIHKDIHDSEVDHSRSSVYESQTSRHASTSTANDEHKDWKKSGVQSLMGGTEEHENILVDWDGPEDPQNPRNWPMHAKISVTIIIWINVFTLDWASASNSQANSVIAKYFGTSEQIELLSPALYTLGIASGAIFAGPISETIGRNPVYFFSRIFHLAWVLGSALAPNIQTQLVCRFFAGLGASIILAIHGASMADIFGPYHRSLAWPFVACGSFYGTVLAPIAGGWITLSAEHGGLSWRWTDWIALIISGFTFIVTAIFLPETFAPILLKWKAAAIRKATNDQRYLSELELRDTFTRRLYYSFDRAWTMTTREPIVILLGLWLVVVYAVIFGFLQGFKYLFKETYDFSDGLKGTVFAAVTLGLTMYTAIVPFFQYLYKRKMISWENDPKTKGSVPPEYRIPPAFIMAFSLPISLFWLGWTNYEWISPWSGLGAVTLFGFSWAGIYNAVYLYILDVYGMYAGSALAAITFYRYTIAAAMTIASSKMYESMGTHWVCTFLGVLAALLSPAPFFFYKYGPLIRAKSRYAGQHTNDIAEKVIEEDVVKNEAKSNSKNIV